MSRARAPRRPPRGPLSIPETATPGRGAGPQASPGRPLTGRAAPGPVVQPAPARGASHPFPFSQWSNCEERACPVPLLCTPLHGCSYTDGCYT